MEQKSVDIDGTILAVIARVAAPILLCATGGMFSMLAGTMNITLEGSMLIAAFAGVAASYFTQNALIGVLAAIFGALLVNLLFGMIHLVMNGEETVTGFAINILCLGLSTFLLRSIFNTSGTLVDPRIVGFGTFSIPILKDIPILGNLFTNQTFAIYFSWLLILLSYFIIYKTKFGMDIRASGENPSAAAAIGVSVVRTRWLCIIITGAMCGLAGAQLSLGYLSMYSENMTAGRGFIALAAIILSGGRPLGVFLASIVFGIADAFANQVQLLNVSSHIVLMFPYLMAIVVLLLQPEQIRKLFNRFRSNRIANTIEESGD
jgi:simple sugar transport system permease protein